MSENDQQPKAGRAGGRAARVAARAAGPPTEERAVRPGFSGGAYTVSYTHLTLPPILLV